MCAQDAAETNRQSVSLSRAEPQRAMAVARDALAKALAEGNAAEAAMARVNIGRGALLLGDYTQAIREMQAGLAEAREHATPLQIAVAAESLAVVFDRTGLHEQSLALHREALRIFETANEWQRAAQVQVNLGNLYDGIGQREESRAHYLRALATLDRIGAEKGRGSIYNNLSQLTPGPGQPDDALDLLDRAMAHYRDENNQIGLGLAWRNRASVLTRQRRFTEAAEAVDMAQRIATGTAHRVGQSAAHEARAELLLAQAMAEAGDRTQRLAAAGSELDKAISIARDLNELHRIERLLRLRSDWAASSGKPELALEMLREAQAAHIEQEDQEATQRLAALSAQFQGERQQLEIARLGEAAGRHQQELAATRLQRNWSAVAAALGGLLAIVAFLYLRERNRLLATERVQSQALQTAITRAESARRVADEERRINGELLALAAHDLHGALGKMVGVAERLLGGDHLSADQRRQIAGIATQANEINEVISNLVAITALDHAGDHPHADTVELVQLLDDLVQQWQSRAAEKRLRMTTRLADAPVVVLGDRMQLAEALEQGIGNAIKFSAPNRRIEARLEATNDRAIIEIHDEGPGLTEQDRRRAFGRFQRLSARPTGGERSTGIGLALVKRIVELHGGDVGFVASTFDSGTCLRIDLPKAAPPN